MGFSPTHLKVENSPRLQGKFEHQSFTKCVVFHVQVMEVFKKAQKWNKGDNGMAPRCNWVRNVVIDQALWVNWKIF